LKGPLEESLIFQEEAMVCCRSQRKITEKYRCPKLLFITYFTAIKARPEGKSAASESHFDGKIDEPTKD